MIWELSPGLFVVMGRGMHSLNISVFFWQLVLIFSSSPLVVSGTGSGFTVALGRGRVPETNWPNPLGRSPATVFRRTASLSSKDLNRCHTEGRDSSLWQRSNLKIKKIACMFLFDSFNRTLPFQPWIGKVFKIIRVLLNGDRRWMV